MFITSDAPDTKQNVLWRRGEMIVGIFALGGAVLYSSKDVMSLSQEFKPKIVGLHSTFWSDTSKADLDDGQWSSLRSNLVLIIIAAILQVFVCRAAQAYGPRCRLQTSLLYGIGFSAYLHGAGFMFLGAMVLANYALASSLRGSRAFPLLTWFGNLGFLIMTEYYHGYKFEDLGLPSYLDHFPKVMSWHRVSNLGMLKIVSFMMDWHWSTKPTEPKGVRYS